CHRASPARRRRDADQGQGGQHARSAARVHWIRHREVAAAKVAAVQVLAGSFGMNRKTLISLVVFLGLGLGAFLALRAPEKGERRGPKVGPAGIAKIEKDQVDELEITNAGKKTTMKKEGDKWWVTAPVRYPADYDAGVKNALEKLADLTWGDVVSEL